MGIIGGIGAIALLFRNAAREAKAAKEEADAFCEGVERRITPEQPLGQRFNQARDDLNRVRLARADAKEALAKLKKRKDRFDRITQSVVIGTVGTSDEISTAAAAVSKLERSFTLARQEVARVKAELDAIAAGPLKIIDDFLVRQAGVAGFREAFDITGGRTGEIRRNLNFGLGTAEAPLFDPQPAQEEEAKDKAEKFGRTIGSIVGEAMALTAVRSFIGIFTGQAANIGKIIGDLLASALTIAISQAIRNAFKEKQGGGILGGVIGTATSLIPGSGFLTNAVGLSQDTFQTTGGGTNINVTIPTVTNGQWARMSDVQNAFSEVNRQLKLNGAV